MCHEDNPSLVLNMPFIIVPSQSNDTQHQAQHAPLALRVACQRIYLFMYRQPSPAFEVWAALILLPFSANLVFGEIFPST